MKRGRALRVPTTVIYRHSNQQGPRVEVSGPAHGDDDEIDHDRDEDDQEDGDYQDEGEGDEEEDEAAWDTATDTTAESQEPAQGT